MSVAVKAALGAAVGAFVHRYFWSSPSGQKIDAFLDNSGIPSYYVVPVVLSAAGAYAGAKL